MLILTAPADAPASLSEPLAAALVTPPFVRSTLTWGDWTPAWSGGSTAWADELTGPPTLPGRSSADAPSTIRL